MANHITELKEKIKKFLYDEDTLCGLGFKLAEETLGINRVYILYGIIAKIFLSLSFNLAGELLCDFIGIAYPAYASIHAIESQTTADDTKWLIYWVVFASFSLIEYFISLIIGAIPLYWLVKCLILLWLMVPGDLNGSIIIYKYVIKPYFLQYHEVVDDAIDKAQTRAKEVAKEVKSQ